MENGITIPELEEILFTFLGGATVVSRTEIFGQFRSVELPESKHEDILTRLIEMSFLGLEIKRDTFEYPDVGSELQLARALAKRYQTEALNQRFQVHRAYRPFLQVQESSDEL